MHDIDPQRAMYVKSEFDENLEVQRARTSVSNLFKPNKNWI